MSVAVDTGYAAGAIAADRSNYWRYYGLRRDPFVPGVRENEFYLSSRWEQSFELMQYLCHEANVLLTVTGGKGSGKSTFLRYFLDHFSEKNWRVCQLSALASLDVTHLIAALTKDFALSSPQGEALEDQLDDQLHQIQYSPQSCLLAIDNAHRLSSETLKALLYLISQQSDDQMQLHIILLGEPHLKERLTLLADQQGENDCCHYLPLEPFDLPETKSYLTRRLSAAGLPAGLPLSSSSIARIHTMTSGVPSRINVVARQMLIDAMNQRQLNSFFDFMRSRRTLLLGGGVLLCLLFVFTSFFARDSHYSFAVPTLITAAKASDDVSESSTLPVMPTPVKSEMLPSLTKPIVVADNQMIDIGPTSAVVVDQSGSKTVAPQQQKIQPPVANVKKIKVTQQSVEKQPVEKKIIHKEKTKVVSTPTKGDYALQLIGVSNEDAMQKFIALHDLKGKTTTLRGHRDGKDWYTLLYGRYPTQTAALKNIQELPKALQDLHPWVRKV